MNRPPEAVGPSEAVSECKGDACCYSKRPLLFAPVMLLGEWVPSPASPRGTGFGRSAGKPLFHCLARKFLILLLGGQVLFFIACG